jgi:hypothetical protein
MATLLERAEQIRDEVQEAANTAQRVGQLLIDLITEMKGADSRYLSGIRPDTAHAPIRFAQGLTAKEVRTEGTEQVQEQLLVGDFLLGQSGARINKDGAAEVETLTVRSRLEVAEMQINRLTAMEDDWLLTESGTVEQVEQRGTQWVLTMRRRFEGDITAFAVHDVIKGIVSTAAVRAFRPNTPLPTPETALYAVAWLRVESVDINDNSITCSLYDNADVPGGANMQPCEGMNLARWGNTSIAERRSCLYLSSREGRIMHLQGVTAPKITAEHQRASFGTLPDFLKAELGEIVDGKDDYLFARGLVVQDIIRLDARANPIPEIVDRGNWTKGAKYFGGTRNPETKRFEISDVWLDGARWRCTTTKSEGTTEEPAPNSIHWTLIQAKPKEGRDGDAGKSAPPTGANLIGGTSFRNMEDVRNWKDFERFAFNQSQEDKVHPLAQAVGAHKNETWIQGVLYIASLLRPNTTYTLSVYSKGAPGMLVLWHLSSTTNRGTLCTNADPNKWTRYAYTFTTPDTIPEGVRIMLRCMDHNAKTYFSALKLEEGEMATPWCLSENDKMATPAANPNLWHCTDYVTRPHFTKGYLDGKPYASILPGGVDGDNYFHVEGNGEERYTHVWWEPWADRYPRGMWYTFSFKCRGSGKAYFGCYPMHGKQQYFFQRIKRNGVLNVWGKQLVLEIPLTDMWTTHSLSVFYDAKEEDLPKSLWTFFKLIKSEGNYLDICHPKMETGEFATPWCLSEKDKKGEKGDPGKDGKSSYTHVAYSAQPDGRGLSFDPTYNTYIGIYTDDKPTASTDHARYVWARFRGENGAPGRTQYMHIAHTNGLESENFKDFTTSNPDGRKFVYIGVCVDEKEPDPTKPEAYQWTKVEGKQGLPGDPGVNGKSSHMHVAYANSDDGARDFTTAPSGRNYAFIGTYTDFEEKASDNPRRYVWAKVEGKPGLPGAPGKPGTAGRGIARVESFYLLTADGTAPGYDTRGWKSKPSVPTSQTPWLWTYERVVYSDGDSERNAVRLVTRLGKDGAEAQPTRPNLLDGTDFHQAGAWEQGINGTHAKTETAKDVQPAVTGCGVLRTMVERGAVGEEYAEFSQRIPADLIAGQDYTFSVYVRGSNTCWMIVFPNSGEHFRLSAAKPGAWQRLSVSFKARAARPGEENRAYLRCWLKNADNAQRHEVLFCAPKLEEGITATPWCLSENDKVGATVQHRGFWDAFPDGTVFRGRNETGGGYEDVVDVLTPAGTREAYRCTRTHTKAGNETRPGANSPYWKKGDSFELVSTGMLLAGTARIENLATGNISQDRMVTAGAEMRFYAAGCKHPGLVFGYRTDTQNRRFPVMQCFDPETGALLYDLGPEGIFANARRVAGTWTSLQMIRLTKYTTISQLYKWLKEEKDNRHDPEIEEMKVVSPYDYDNGKEFPLYEFGYGAYYTEGWSEFRRADGSMHKIFEGSRTSIPTEDYPAAFWFNPLGNNYFTTAPPENVLVDEHGAAMGDLNFTRVEDGWYCSRLCPIRVERPNFQINVKGRTRNAPLYAIELWKFHAGKKVETGTTYFVEFDLDNDPEAADDGRAHKGRNRYGDVYKESRDIHLVDKAIFEIQGFESRTNNSIKPQQN